MDGEGGCEMFRFLRVNMSAGTCVFEDISQEYAGLGWRALTSTIVAREVEPHLFAPRSA